MRTGSSLATAIDSAPHTSARRILIIDDDKFWQTRIHGYLRFETTPLVVDVADTAEDALALFEYGERYDIIIADYLLEGRRNGRELFQAMKQKDNSTFLLTSAADVIVNAEDFSEGMRFVNKNHLRSTIKDILAEQKMAGGASKSSWTEVFQNKIQLAVCGSLLLISALYMASLVMRNGLPK